MNKPHAAFAFSCAAIIFALMVMMVVEAAWDTSGSVDMEQIKWPPPVDPPMPQHIRQFVGYERPPPICVPMYWHGGEPKPAAATDGPDDL
jgi:hypothetical protein